MEILLRLPGFEKFKTVHHEKRLAFLFWTATPFPLDFNHVSQVAFVVNKSRSTENKTGDVLIILTFTV